MVAPRLPLPAKVLLSYLAVLAAGAVPALAYVEYRLEDQLLRYEAEKLAVRAQTIGTTLAGQSPAVVRRTLEELSRTSELRLTAIHASGDVFFDTHVGDPSLLVSHRDRPEVRQVLDGAPPERPTIDPGVAGVGAALRRSATTGHSLLYVSTRVPGAEGEPWVLRLARPTSGVRSVSASASAYVRNALALSLSVALLFTLLAAYRLTRPLIRVREAAQALAAGDFGAPTPPVTRDEIGDVASALQRLGRELRAKMAAAGSGEALLHQLVESLRQPAIVMAPGGELIAINGAARRMLELEGPQAREAASALLENARVREALAAAAEQGAPAALTLPDGQAVWATVLRRPGAEPLQVLLGPAAVEEDKAPLPSPDEVVTVALTELVEKARAVADRVVEDHELALVLPDAGIPEVTVADAADRAADALGKTIAAVAATVSARTARLSLDFLLEGARVGVFLEGRLDEDDADEVHALIDPLGGELEVELGEVTLWLPRA